VKWTLLALIRAPFPGAAAVSRNTAPVNHSAGPGVVSLILVTFIRMLLGRAASWYATSVTRTCHRCDEPRSSARYVAVQGPLLASG